MTPLDRRSFVAAAASMAAASVVRPSATVAITPEPIGRVDDPLGVRSDFPIVNERTFLNSAYIAPIPMQVVAAGHSFLEEKARRSFQLGPLLKKCDEVRARFARLIRAASADEIGLLFSTGEGENVVAAGLGLKAGDNVVIDELPARHETDRRRRSRQGSAFLYGCDSSGGHVRTAIADRLRLDRYGEMHAGPELPDHSYEIPTNAKRFDYSSRAFGDVYTLGAGLSYLEKVGVDRIEGHTVDNLARRLQEGLEKQGHRLFTPPGNRSAIVTFYTAKPPSDVRAAFQSAHIEVTVRDGTVRVSPALFNNADDIDRCLATTRKLV